MISDHNISDSNASGKSASYMPQLDSLRTFAVFSVLIGHWFAEFEKFSNFPFGMFGVTLFFVLSGFLITQILISGRIDTEEIFKKKIHSIKQFYIRRTLRIFPIYYITIFICLLFNVQDIRDKFFWFLFYASNIYFYNINDWAGSLSHLWTLAVEEQFYLVWPFIILFIPSKHLLKSIIGIIIFGAAFRSILFIANGSKELESMFILILTPSCMDSFGLGALLAYCKIFEKFRYIFSSKISAIFLFLNIVSFFVLYLFSESAVSVFLFRLNISVVCVFIIYKASSGFRGVAGKILELPFLIYLGKISYGLYLYHNFIPMICKVLGLPAFGNIYINFMVQLSLLILISSLSWFLIEKPINGLKKYFSYN